MTQTAPKTRAPILRGESGLIFLTAVLAAGLTGPGQTIGVSVFIDHFVEDLALSRPLVSTAYLIGTLTGALFLPSVGRFIDRHGVRRAQIIIGLLFAGALVNMSLVQGFVTLAIGFVGIRFLGQGSLSLITTVTVSLRFVQNRGTALGLYSTINAGSLALAPLVLAGVIAWVGWRQAWVVAAVVIAFTVAPLAYFGLAKMPTSSAEAQLTSSDSDAYGFTRSEALRTRGFWILTSISTTAGMLATALNFHQIDLLQEAGLSATAAAGMFLPQVIGSTASGFAFGVLLDRVGGRYLPAVSIALLALAHLLGALAAPGVRVFAYAIVLGAASGAIRTVSSALLPKWFGTANLGEIQGTMTLIGVAGTAVGPVVLALLEQRLGSYPPAIRILGLIPVAVAVFALLPPFGHDRVST